MRFIARFIRRSLNLFSKWEYLGTDDDYMNKYPNLSAFVHYDILATLDHEARMRLWSGPVYAKGKTYLYKAIPGAGGSWADNQGHGERYLHIYRKQRRQDK